MRSDVKKPRIVWIDLLESLAIFGVILCHNMLYNADVSQPGANRETYVFYLFRTLLATCVPLFFFVNGFLLFRKPFDLKRHAQKTLKYIIITSIWSVVALVALNWPHFSLSSFFANLWVSKENLGYLWFMGALVCVYAFFPILKAAYDTNKKLIIYFIIMCAIFTFGNTLLNQLRTLYSVGLMHSAEVFTDVNFFRIFNPFQGIHGYVFVYFCLGGLMNIYLDKIQQIPAKIRNIGAVVGIIAGSLGLFAIGVLYSQTTGFYYDVIWNGYDTIFTFISAAGVFLLCLNYHSQNHKLNHFLKTISCNTLGIYFIHIILVFLTIDYLRSIPWLCTFWGTTLYGVALFAVSLVLSMLVKRIPILKHLVG